MNDPGGPNVTTRGIDLLGLPQGMLLRLGDEAVVQVTGLPGDPVTVEPPDGPHVPLEIV